jgi:hypothetical protein
MVLGGVFREQHFALSIQEKDGIGADGARPAVGADRPRRPGGEER